MSHLGDRGFARAFEIEKALGSAQDIEGCIDQNGALYVVQTRPQV